MASSLTSVPARSQAPPIVTFMASYSSTGVPTGPQSQDRVYSEVTFSSRLIPLSLKLDQNNLSSWRSQVLPTIRAHGLEGFLLGNIPCPDQFLDSTIVNGNGETETIQITNQEFVSWTRHDQFLMSWLLSSMTESMLRHVIRCKIVAGIWSSLDQLFNIKYSKVRIL